MAAKSYSRFVCLIVLLGLIVSAGPAVAQTPAQDSSYRIGPNDILNIFVWKEAELTRDVIVMPDGKITYPLIGEIGPGPDRVGAQENHRRQAPELCHRA